MVKITEVNKKRKATVYLLGSLIGSIIFLVFIAAWMGDHGYADTKAYINNITKYIALATMVYGVILCGVLAYLDRKV